MIAAISTCVLLMVFTALTNETRPGTNVSIEGLLFNSRMVQATFVDLNVETRERWAYLDTNVWDADRNLREFLASIPEWRKHGFLGITVNLQGGSPQGYSNDQPWHNSGFTETGALRPEYTKRLEQVLEHTDRRGMIVIVGYFYFGQDQRLKNETAVVAATDAAALVNTVSSNC